MAAPPAGSSATSSTTARSSSTAATSPAFRARSPGTGAVAQIGTGTEILTGDNTYTGGTTIAAGTLQLGAGGASGSIVGNVTDDSALAFDRSDVVIFPARSPAPAA